MSSDTAFVADSVAIEMYSSIPTRARSELRSRFRRRFRELGVKGQPIIVAYRSGSHLLRFEWFIGPEALAISRVRRAALR